MTPLALVADDYTGAGDSAIHFVEAGAPFTLMMPASGWPTAPSVLAGGLAFASESRFLSPDAAGERVAAIFRLCREHGIRRFFKKVDSGMRGNPGREIEAALVASGRSAALLCPAIPALGRTCVDGQILLHGKPLADSEVGRDKFTPLASSRVADIVAAQTDLPLGDIRLETIRKGAAASAKALAERLAAGARIVVVDADTDADLDILAGLLAANPELLAAGASGLSKAVAGREAASAGGVAAGAGPMRGRMLAVCGSQTRTTADQVAQAVACGYRRLVLNVDAARRDAEAECARLFAEATEHPEAHLVLVAESGSGEAGKRLGLEIAALLGEAAKRLFRNGGCRVLFCTGGSTAIAVAAALGIGAVRLERELMPGVVRGAFAADDGGMRWFVSKAGGFGDRDTLCRLLEHVER